MARPNREIAIHAEILEHCKNGIGKAMCLITKKQSLNADDIQALRILGDVYAAMINPCLENCAPLLEDCNR